MDTAPLFALTLCAALATGLMAGLLFGFSSLVMRALAALPAPKGLAAMQSINASVNNPLFMGAFLGAAALSAATAVVSLVRWGEPGSGWLLTGGLLYVIGTFVETIAIHIPRNNTLAALDPDSPDSAAYWSGYVRVWTAWNHVRTAAALAASAAFVVALATD